LQAHLHFCNVKADAKNAKEPAIFPRKKGEKSLQNLTMIDLPAPNSMLAIAAGSALIWQFVFLL
jgi:hypothetical protein